MSGEGSREIGVVVIGRNEGDRLRRCLESIRGRAGAVVYVDSGSTDGSPEAAKALGAEVVTLDASLPFTAARGRNEGFFRLMERSSPPGFVQFVDGDCEFADGWLEAARAALEARPDVAVVGGRRREKFPENSLYNRLADLEWDRPSGEVESCGGDAMARAGAIVEVGGYDPSVAAGEEPEMCFRLRKTGWKVLRLDAEMTRHDMAMTRFSQWWKRKVRGGRGALDVFLRCGKGRDVPFARQVKGARVWTLGWAAVSALAIAVGWSLGGPIAAASVAGLAALAPVAQAMRIARGARKRVGSLGDALAFGALTMVGKWAEIAGQGNYYRDRARGRGVRLIEYKGPEAAGSAVP